LGLRDLFRKDEVSGSKVLVCSFDAKFSELIKSDSEVYSSCYPSTTASEFSGIPHLKAALAQQPDIAHLFCDVSLDGVITDARGNTITGTELIELCCDSDVKLLWIASANKPEGYIKAFNPRGKRINLVMTLNRLGPNFSHFLGNLLAQMSLGEAMPVVWNQLCPQMPRSAHPDAPECIFFAGRGGVRLR
jgi:hypothetical protein